MNGKKWFRVALLGLPLAIGGIALAVAQLSGSEKTTYTCPLTGQELPCPKCCPMGHNQ